MKNQQIKTLKLKQNKTQDKKTRGHKTIKANPKQKKRKQH